MQIFEMLLAVLIYCYSDRHLLAVSSPPLVPTPSIQFKGNNIFNALCSAYHYSTATTRRIEKNSCHITIERIQWVHGEEVSISY